MGGYSILLVVILALAVTSSKGVRVDTEYGAVIGQSHTLHDGKEVNSFLGIPFAKPPVGSLRWKAPEDPDPWKEPFVADRIRSACSQATGLIVLTHLFWQDFSEDCLHLNIYTPKDMTKGPYPVLFWIHGGGFTSGANFQYPGYFVASRNIIVVTVNYRVGAIGFASTGDSVSTGNFGLLDQHKALLFVQKNIKYFGGDPNKVTIAGESAGAAAVGFHTLSPMSKGLFHQAIYQSGNDLAKWAYKSKAEESYRYTQQLAANMSCPTDNTEAMMNCLRTKPADTLMEFEVTCKVGFICSGFGPVADGRFLPDNPDTLRKAGRFTKVPILTGINKDEGGIYIALVDLEGADDGYAMEEFRGFLQNFSRLATLDDPSKTQDFYEANRFYYSPWGQLDNKASNREKLIEMITDVMFGYPEDMVMRYSVKHSPVYSYLLTYRSSNATELFPEWMGVFHAMDLPYTWGFSFLTRNPSVDEESQFTHDIIDYNKEDDIMSDYIMDMWANFVKTGNPTPVPIGPAGKEAITWKPYEVASQQKLIVARQPYLALNYRQRNYAFDREYLPYIVSKGRQD